MRVHRGLRVLRGPRGLFGAFVLAGLLVGATPVWAAIARTPAHSWGTNGRVITILRLNGITYIGGSFTSVENHSGNRVAVENLAAIRADGSLVRTWTPRANHPVKALAAVGGNVLAGGAFSQIDGHTRLHLALLTPGGEAVSFRGHTNREVDALAVSGTTVYAGGLFTRANGTSRLRAAAFSASGGDLQRWRPDADGRIDAILPVTGRIILGGMFHEAGGAGPAHLTAVDPSTGRGAGWSAHTPASVLGLTAGASAVFAALGGSGGAVASYDTAGRLQWRAQTDGNVQAITTAAGEVVAGGHFDNICDWGTDCANPIVRHKLAAFDQASGKLDTRWHPSVNSPLGVFALLGTPGWLEVGGDFTKVGGVAQPHYARFKS